MNEMRIEIDGGRNAFVPGEEISGKAIWRLEKPPRAVDLRLFWFTRGKGTEDGTVVEITPFEQPHSDESRSFRFTLPSAPYSFSGKLISVVWALELVATPSGALARLEIVVAPGGQEVHLGTVEIAAASKRL